MSPKKPKEDKIVKLSDHNNSALSWSLEDMFDSIKDKLKTEEYKNHKQGVVLLLNDTGQMYETAYFACGIKTPEIVTLLSVAQKRFINLLGH